MSTTAYPVRVNATLREPLSRWLWLVKWALALPHYLVLAVLWVAFVVLSGVAMVAILITGRYPRGIFDFNVGVLRWTWRVAYYAYGGLGTDQYPPFALEERADYPAHLEIEYPERLSRGLVLVKWWLLALPHYIVVGIFIGSGWHLVTTSEGLDVRYGGGGLIGLLVLVAAVVLTVTGRYPRPVFDLVLGLNRWVLRVAAYVGLMTDSYPPFRLDMGETDPGPPVATMPRGSVSGGNPSGGSPVTTTAPTPAPPPGGTSGWGAGRIIGAIIGCVLAVSATGLIAGGGIVRFTDGALRDESGFVTSSDVRLESPGYAVTSQAVELHGGVGSFDVPQRWLGTVKVEAVGHTTNGVFVGIARTTDVDRYLRGVARSVVVEPADDEGEPVLRFTDGGSPRVSPTDTTFWAASATGPGRQTVTWEARTGSWTLVVMNGEGTTPVDADVAVGATVPILDEVAWFLLIAGLVTGTLAAVLLVISLRRPTTPRTGGAS